MRLSALLLLALMAVSPAASAEEAEPLTFGLAQVYGADAAAQDGGAISAYLSKELGLPVKSEVFKDYDSLAKALSRKKIDLAWITPLPLVKALRGGAVAPLAKAQRKGSFFYRACLFARDGKGGTDLASLKGLKAVWVDKGSTSGYLMPQALVMKSGNRTRGFFSGESFAGSHRQSCEAVLAGGADVGATFTDADSNPAKPLGCSESLGAEKTASLRCVAVSERVPNEVIAARDGLEEGLATQLTGLFTGLSATEDGRKLLSGTFRAETFGFALEEDFDGVRNLQTDVEVQKAADADKSTDKAAEKSSDKAAGKGGKPTGKKAGK